MDSNRTSGESLASFCTGPWARQVILYSVIITTVGPVAAIAQEAGESIEPGTDSTSLWAMIQQGGWAMYPLGLCSLAFIFLVIQGWRETRRKRFIPKGALHALTSLFSARDLDAAVKTLNENPTVLSRATIASLAKARPDMPDANKEKVEASFLDAVEGEESSIGQWINYLNVVATISPMIGLLGTVSGMIGAFSTIKRAGMGRPELLAGDIGEALITTATGLVIGIPAMIFYFILRNRLNNGILATTHTATILIDYLAGELEAKSDQEASDDS